MAYYLKWFDNFRNLQTVNYYIVVLFWILSGIFGPLRTWLLPILSKPSVFKLYRLNQGFDTGIRFVANRDRRSLLFSEVFSTLKLWSLLRDLDCLLNPSTSQQLRTYEPSEFRWTSLADGCLMQSCRWDATCLHLISEMFRSPPCSDKDPGSWDEHRSWSLGMRFEYFPNFIYMGYVSAALKRS